MNSQKQDHDYEYYQNLTEQIARDGGLQTDLRQFFDPIYQNEMMRVFLQRLIENKGHKLGKMAVSWVLLTSTGMGIVGLMYKIVAIKVLLSMLAKINIVKHATK